MNLVEDAPEGPRTLANLVFVMALTPREASSKAKILSAIFPSQRRSRLSPLIWPCAFPPAAVQSGRLDIARGRFPKEFAINASSLHCASICFRLSTRGRRVQWWWKQTSDVPSELSAISFGRASSRENGAGSIGLIAIASRNWIWCNIFPLGLFSLDADSRCRTRRTHLLGLGAIVALVLIKLGKSAMPTPIERINLN